jgi:hypothetical protein
MSTRSELWVIENELKLNWKLINSELKLNKKLGTQLIIQMNELHGIGICDNI